MELLGHVGIALAVYAPLAALAVGRDHPRRAWAGLLCVLPLSVAPDVDLLLPGVAHRGITHTALAALVVGAAVGLAAARVVRSEREDRSIRAGFGAIAGSSAVASHLVGDMLTPMGIRPFLPFSETTYTLSLVRAADPAANLTLLALGVAAFALAVARPMEDGRGAEPEGIVDPDDASSA